MHIRALLLPLAAALVLGACAKKPADKLVGEWKGTANGQPVSFIFRRDRTAELVNGNDVIGGTPNGKVEWRMDPTRDPIVVDIFVTEPSGQQVVIMPMIIRFITDRKLQVKIGSMGSQPVAFSSTDTHDQVVLDKQ